jgi:CHAD domain-containing protein
MVRLEELKAGPALVVCALVVNERNETAEYLGTLSPAERKRVDYVFRRLAELGRAGFRDGTFKRLEGVVCEIKEHRTNTRLFCFMSGHRLIVCTHAARKPAGRVRYHVEMDKVRRLYELCLTEGVLP